MDVVKLVPEDVIEIYSAQVEIFLELPFVGGGISAGFPSPADDYLEAGMDLNE